MIIQVKALGLVLARIIYVFNIFNLRNTGCHQTGTCHWEHAARLLIAQQEYHDFVKELGTGLDF